MCDKIPKMQDQGCAVVSDLNRHSLYPGGMRHSSLFCATCSGSQDILKWLVDRVGVQSRIKAELAHLYLCPVDLATGILDERMANLLFDLQAEQTSARCAEKCACRWRGAEVRFGEHLNTLLCKTTMSSYLRRILSCLLSGETQRLLARLRE
jgi:hypothetical protein